jgi:hypothetical protein
MWHEPQHLFNAEEAIRKAEANNKGQSELANILSGLIGQIFVDIRAHFSHRDKKTTSQKSKE